MLHNFGFVSSFGFRASNLFYNYLNINGVAKFFLN